LSAQDVTGGVGLQHIASSSAASHDDQHGDVGNYGDRFGSQAVEAAANFALH